MKTTKGKPALLQVPRLKVSADGAGVVSHAGVGLLREVADLSGLTSKVSAVLADTYKGPWVHDPGRVFTDLAAAVADGADCVSGIGHLGDQQAQHGPIASVTTTWRMLDARIDDARLVKVKDARATAREKVWAAGAAPQPGTTLVIDVDATISIDQSEGKENSAATWKHTYGYHPLLAFLDRPDIAGGEALAALLRPGNAGSNTAADHVVILTEALGALPIQYRPVPAVAGDKPAGPDTFDGTQAPKVLVRSDTAGATHAFAKACRDAGVGFSFGHPVNTAVKAALDVLAEGAVTAHFDNINVWQPAVTSDNTIRDGAWVAEATHLADLSAWPAGTRLILRKERPHPGAQLRFTDVDGHRITAFITDTPAGVIPGQIAGLDLRHRQHARVEDRIRQAKATGLRNFPCHDYQANNAWLEVVMTAIDLIAWTKLIGFKDHPDLARCEIAAFRYRVLHVAARITRGARNIYLKLDATWKWGPHIAQAWHLIRAALA